MRNEASVEVDRPIEEVFRIAVERMSEWSTVVVEDEVLEEKPDRVGTTFRLVTEDHGKRMEFQGVVTRYEPPHVSAVRMTNEMLDIETEFSFTDLSGRTRVHQTANVNGKGFWNLLMIVFGWLTHKSACESSQNELEQLKKFCEGPPLADDTV